MWQTDLWSVICEELNEENERKFTFKVKAINHQNIMTSQGIEIREWLKFILKVHLIQIWFLCKVWYEIFLKLVVYTHDVFPWKTFLFIYSSSGKALHLISEVAQEHENGNHSDISFKQQSSSNAPGLRQKISKKHDDHPVRKRKEKKGRQQKRQKFKNRRETTNQKVELTLLCSRSDWK